MQEKLVWLANQHNLHKIVTNRIQMSKR